MKIKNVNLASSAYMTVNWIAFFYLPDAAKLSFKVVDLKNPKRTGLLVLNVTCNKFTLANSTFPEGRRKYEMLYYQERNRELLLRAPEYYNKADKPIFFKAYQENIGIDEINHEFFEMCNLVFRDCFEFWKISPAQMRELAIKYKLASHILKLDDLLNSYGPGGVAEIMERHINRSGGTVRHGE